MDASRRFALRVRAESGRWTAASESITSASERTPSSLSSAAAAVVAAENAPIRLGRIKRLGSTTPFSMQC